MTNKQLGKGQILQIQIYSIRNDLARFKGYELPFFDGHCKEPMKVFKTSVIKEMNTELDRLEKEFRKL